MNMVSKRLGCLAIGFLACLLPVLAAPTQGYIDAESFNVAVILPKAPAVGTARYEADSRIFLTTRALRDTPRWDMAANDVRTGPADLMTDFSCAVGVTLTPKVAPRLAHLVARAGADTGTQSARAKDFFKRLRPFLIDHGATCQSADDVAQSYDYPSGHTTLGWTWATILAELMPDRATQILARGRAYGESRIVCGVHNASAVEAGRLSAAATMSVVRATTAYRRDLLAARKELLGLRQHDTRPDAAM